MHYDSFQNSIHKKKDILLYCVYPRSKPFYSLLVGLGYTNILYNQYEERHKQPAIIVIYDDVCNINPVKLAIRMGESKQTSAKAGHATIHFLHGFLLPLKGWIMKTAITCVLTQRDWQNQKPPAERIGLLCFILSQQNYL